MEGWRDRIVVTLLIGVFVLLGYGVFGHRPRQVERALQNTPNLLRDALLTASRNEFVRIWNAIADNFRSNQLLRREMQSVAL